MANYNSKHTGSQIDSAVARALAGGSIDKALENAVADINKALDKKVPAEVPARHLLTAENDYTLTQRYYWKTADGVVHLMFGVKKSDDSEITGMWTIFSTLPAGYRPYGQIFPAAVNQAGELVKICIYGSDGYIRVHNVAPPSGTTEILFVTSFVAEN